MTTAQFCLICQMSDGLVPCPGHRSTCRLMMYQLPRIESVVISHYTLTNELAEEARFTERLPKPHRILPTLPSCTFLSLGLPGRSSPNSHMDGAPTRADSRISRPSKGIGTKGRMFDTQTREEPRWLGTELEEAGGWHEQC